jgi:hypothetical protein
LPDLTEAITEAQQGLAESGTPTEDQARATVTALSDSISAARSAQTPNDFTKLLATLSEKREFAEKAATKLASDFASQVNLAAAAAAAQRASAALQELFADVTQAIARSAASPMDAVINPALITRTITVRGSNLSPDALFEIDGADLPFRMLLDAQGKQMPDVLIRDETTPTLARVMQLKIDPARLEGSDRDQFRAWFSVRGSRTFTLTNPDGQKAELTFQLPPGETQKADTSP